MPLQPPTSTLPPIQNISFESAKDLSEALSYLRQIYNPEVRGARRSKTKASCADTKVHPSLPSNIYTAEVTDDLRSDSFERSYAIRWLTSLVAQAEVWDPDSDATHPSFSVSCEEMESLIQNAASLLAICSGTAAAGVIARDFVFEKGQNMLKVHIKDAPLDNADYGSVGAQTWGGACVLAETIVNDPASFGILEKDPDTQLRILELGSGTGLVSLTVGKLLEVATGTVIIATDYYPSVLENLQSNISANFPSPEDVSNGPIILSHFLDWSLFGKEPALPPFDIPFDVVLGADIVYEAQHAIWIKSCLAKLLRKPTLDADPRFHLIIPLRTTHAAESSTIEAVFSSSKNDQEIHLEIISKEIIVCDAGSGGGPEQVEYAYYKIGWR
ncbi:hypothetical protein H0H81_000537 [Sphagnurus paluster]|uniref:Uncharacterized protein n=1 Tax=Sphagnurus paluster TaxID=117069 RepID=A0A9P7GU10_9AGAR|nr:hypothetical protein H0H81_000537 [Sphagnurus paluster]